MNEATRYRYEKRIKELEERIDALRIYRDICWRIHESIANLAQDGKTISQIWVIRQFKDAWK